MLLEIAAANAAFGIIKEALTNGKELYEVADTVGSYFDNKSIIAKKAKQGGNGDELSAFMELQKLKKEEEWLKEYMIYAGDPGVWDAWLQFQSDRKRQREAAAKAKIYKKAQKNKLLLEWVTWGAVVLISLPLLFFLIVMGIEMLK
jgi:hypothetical protein